MMAVGVERRFDGLYFVHWEVPRFEFVSRRSLWGLLKRYERCRLSTAEGVESVVDKLGLSSRDSPGQVLAVSFIGKVLERGRFGHRGWCRWRLLVQEWLTVERVR